jgi:o-succinylbenzoate synthase
MKIIEFKYAKLAIPFKYPLRTSERSYNIRDTILLRLKDSSGNIGMGECSPLPPFGKESIGDTEYDLAKAREIILDSEDSIDVLERKDKLFNKSFPSVKFGVDQALIDLGLKADRESVKEKFRLRNEKKIPVNGLIGLVSLEESMREARRLAQTGYGTLKVKIGRDDFNEDLQIVKRIRSTVGDTVKIRLDANGAWSIENTLERLDSLKPYDIEYIEDPVYDLSELNDLAGESAVPIAADEPLKNSAICKEAIDSGRIACLIYKPMLIGGLKEFLKIFEAARERKIIIVVSSVFETSIGRSFLAFLASCIGDDTAHGIGTSGFLAEEPAVDPYRTDKGKINYQLIDYPPKYRFTNDIDFK